MYENIFKRGIDIILSFMGLIILSPLLTFLSIWIHFDSPGPILFKQNRFSKNGEIFEILKFRTMRIDAPKDMPTHMLSNPDEYITRSGKFLRKTSLDELPQMVNILRGEMAIIGPRPALWNQSDLMKLRYENGSYKLRPGLSGWAQIHGRDELPINQKAALDGEYARNLSFLLDCKCFAATFLAVLRQDGIQEGVLESDAAKKIIE